MISQMPRTVINRGVCVSAILAQWGYYLPEPTVEIVPEKLPLIRSLSGPGTVVWPPATSSLQAPEVVMARLTPQSPDPEGSHILTWREGSSQASPLGITIPSGLGATTR